MKKRELYKRLNLFRKRRFSMLDATTNNEEWYIHISPARIISGLVAFVLLVFILILTLMAYTPVLELLPGYRTEADRTREQLVESIMRLDSMEKVIDNMLSYNESISIIMEGKTPVSASVSETDSIRLHHHEVLPSKADSILRQEMEGEGTYSLAKNAEFERRKLRETLGLEVPAEGLITEKFDISQSCFGVRMAVKSGDRITAVDNGTVMQSIWTPEKGSIIVLQHAGNLVSIYKNLSRALVNKGQKVNRGELIGYNFELEEGDTTPLSDKETVQEPASTRYFEFELWSNGKAVNPEEYISF